MDQSDPARIGPNDSRYAVLQRRGFNKRFACAPDYFRMGGSTADVVDAVQDAVRTGRRVAVRSGGHCLEGLVADPEVRVVIDMSQMTSIAWDPAMRAFMIEAGATVGEVHRKLYHGWGVVLPLGQSPDIGIGGHVLGSAFGFLHREHGLAGDHLHAVEVVVVDGSGQPTAVVATRDPNDPNHDLWWAHTGGGGGNFGIVTRYWFRSPESDGRVPARSLPGAPDSVTTLEAKWAWEDIDEHSFAALLRGYGAWAEAHSGVASPFSTLFSVLTAGCRHVTKTIELRGLSTAGPQAERQLHEHLSAVADYVGARHVRRMEQTSWLAFALDPFPELFAIRPGGAAASMARLKIKDAVLRRRHTDRQIDVMCHALMSPGERVGGGIGLATYGGRMNGTAPSATAAAQRGSVLDTACTVGWGDPADEARSLAWVRALYRAVFDDTGGVPVPGPATEGALINHPDADLADPEWNRSGVPWHAIYYLDNYARLQRVKARWDPRNVFHHALSVVPPDGAG